MAFGRDQTILSKLRVMTDYHCMTSAIDSLILQNSQIMERTTASESLLRSSHSDVGLSQLFSNTLSNYFPGDKVMHYK